MATKLSSVSNMSYHQWISWFLAFLLAAFPAITEWCYSAGHILGGNSWCSSLGWGLLAESNLANEAH